MVVSKWPYTWVIVIFGWPIHDLPMMLTTTASAKVPTMTSSGTSSHWSICSSNARVMDHCPAFAQADMTSPGWVPVVCHGSGALVEPSQLWPWNCCSIMGCAASFAHHPKVGRLPKKWCFIWLFCASKLNWDQTSADRTHWKRTQPKSTGWTVSHINIRLKLSISCQVTWLSQQTKPAIFQWIFCARLHSKGKVNKNNSIGFVHKWWYQEPSNLITVINNEINKATFINSKDLEVDICWHGQHQLLLKVSWLKLGWHQETLLTLSSRSWFSCKPWSGPTKFSKPKRAHRTLAVADHFHQPRRLLFCTDWTW